MNGVFTCESCGTTNWAAANQDYYDEDEDDSWLCEACENYDEDAEEEEDDDYELEEDETGEGTIVYVFDDES
ncbi:MAG: hypothetical protein ACRCZJ_07620 [Erysipelotrichaceae bacterium]